MLQCLGVAGILTPRKSQGSPPMVQNLKNGPITDFDSSIEASRCTECNAKNLSSLQAKKEREKIKPKKNNCCDLGQKWVFLEVFIILSEIIL